MNTLTWAVSDQLAGTKPLGQSRALSNSFLGAPRPQGLRPQVRMADWAPGGLGEPIPRAVHRVSAWTLSMLASVPMGAPLPRAQGWVEGRGQRGHPVLWGWVVTPVPDTTAVLALT